jgi:uncharacterized membrane protein
MKLRYTKFQRIIELFTVIVVLGTCIYLIQSWGSLPNKIPEHYNGAGIIDSWENKSEILTMPILSIALYILITVMSFFPAIWNVPITITEDNREFVYLRLKTMIILTKMEMIVVFSYITYCDIKLQPLGVWFLPLSLIIIFGTIIYYIVKICKKI